MRDSLIIKEHPLWDKLPKETQFAETIYEFKKTFTVI